MYSDGTGFEGKEDHVWLDLSGFEKFSVGDCVGFCIANKEWKESMRQELLK
jgi:hypothetical protein